MPTTYAHKKFGALVYKRLPKEARQLIADNYEFFLAGLHGPDVLFYHKPGFKTTVPQVGSGVHKKPFSVFYDKAIKYIKENEYEEDIVYILGCICHFVLDKNCHPIVAKGIDATGMSHGKIEMELDRELITRDGHKPIKYPAYAHLPISREVAIVASQYYKGISEGVFLSSLITMKAAFKACGTGNDTMRKIICKIMDMAGEGEKVASLVMSRDRSKLCRDYVLKLCDTLEGCVDEAVVDISNALSDISGEIKKNPEYKYNFSGKRVV